MCVGGGGARFSKIPEGLSQFQLVCVGVGGGGGRGGGRERRRNRKYFFGGVGCAAGTVVTPPNHIFSRLTKLTYSYNLHVKRYPIHIIEEY